MVSDPLGLLLAGPFGAPAGRSFWPLCPPQPCPSPHRHSLQQVLLLCMGIVVMVLFSLFVE